MRRIDRHDRETFIAELLKQVPTATRSDALRLLRWGRTYGRLAEAQYNGDWPALDGSTDAAWLCETCDGQWRTEMKHGCPACRAERIIRETCERMAQEAQDAGESY